MIDVTISGSVALEAQSTFSQSQNHKICLSFSYLLVPTDNLEGFVMNVIHFPIPC